ncbi:MAG: M20/M25/M40 family metallo-hydrolase [Flavisolibacter sp.]
MIRKYLLPLLLLMAVAASAQKLKKEDRQLEAHLRAHIEYLSSDSLEGRLTGTPGEKKAADYIREAFRQEGLQAPGNSLFYQSFEINEGKQIDPSTTLMINGKKLVLHEAFFPLAFSASASLEATASPALQEPRVPWFFDLKEFLEAHGDDPAVNLYDFIREKAKKVSEKGATALLVYNTSTREDGLHFEAGDASTASIPVLYLRSQAAREYLGDESASLDLALHTAITEKKRTGTNVMGWLDNGAQETVVLGAHFDHLGHGEEGFARDPGKKGQVYHGADDNASGTAALLELARLIKENKLKNYNYLFIAFSGEELGLYGSKYFLAHPAVDLAHISYMINMDMVGRLNDSSKLLMVGGYGSSPAWGALYHQKGKNKLYEGDLVFRFDSSGTGPSDHTSFYLRHIPVLFYFTGLHSDYHQPSDRADKINYPGEITVIKHIFSLVKTLDKQPEKLAFTPTRENAMGSNTSFSVTLGILPDYSYAGEGVRIDAVSDNRPAQKAGLQSGDVIVALGGIKVHSLETYMQALGQFKKGDTSVVYYTRAGKTLSAQVSF